MTSSAVTTPLILSILLGVIFLLNEVYVTPDSIIPRSMFRQKTLVLVGCSNIFIAACTTSVTYHFPTWFQVVRGESKGQSGFHLLQNSIGLAAGSFFTGYVRFLVTSVSVHGYILN